jgi:hypothetical protein
MGLLGVMYTCLRACLVRVSTTELAMIALLYVVFVSMRYKKSSTLFSYFARYSVNDFYWLDRLPDICRY